MMLKLGLSRVSVLGPMALQGLGIDNASEDWLEFVTQFPPKPLVPGLAGKGVDPRGPARGGTKTKRRG